uniref:Uncharacterized protein n=1 Tax=Arundo donax TaxID=35708 RepID=A0A0A9GVA2_ARUDO
MSDISLNLYMSFFLLLLTNTNSSENFVMAIYPRLS